MSLTYYLLAATAVVVQLFAPVCWRHQKCHADNDLLPFYAVLFLFLSTIQLRYHSIRLFDFVYRLRQVDVKAEHFERQVARIEQERDQWETKYEEAQGKYLASKRELEELAQQVRGFLSSSFPSSILFCWSSGFPSLPRCVWECEGCAYVSASVAVGNVHFHVLPFPGATAKGGTGDPP